MSTAGACRDAGCWILAVDKDRERPLTIQFWASGMRWQEPLPFTASRACPCNGCASLLKIHQSFISSNCTNAQSTRRCDYGFNFSSWFSVTGVYEACSCCLRSDLFALSDTQVTFAIEMTLQVYFLRDTWIINIKCG